MRFKIALYLTLLFVQVTLTVAEHLSNHDGEKERHHRRRSDDHHSRKHYEENDYADSYHSEEEIPEEWHGRRKHHTRRKEEDPEHFVSENMKKLLGARGHKEASELLHQLTGHYDEMSAIKYIENITGLTDEHKVLDFLKKAKGSRNWKYVIEFLKLLDESPYINIIVEILRQMTNENDVLQAFAAMKPLTGHDDFDGVYESLQKISGEKDPHEIADYFKHVAHTSGLEGIKLEIHKLTSGIGPSEFPSLLKVLLPEIDMKGAFNLLILGTRTVDIGDAITAVNHLLKTKSLAESIIILRTVTKQTQLKYALEELTQSLNRGSLRVIIENLYKIGGCEHLLEVQQIFKDVFGTDNILNIIHKINKVTKRQDALYFLNSLLDITQTRNMKEAGDIIQSLTMNHMSLLDILEQIRIKSGHEDIIDFFKRLMSITGTKSIQDAWQVMISVTSIRDMFMFFDKVYKYTNVEVIIFLETILRVTNATNIRVAMLMLNKLCGLDDFFDIIQLLFEITDMDVVKFFENIITISKAFYLEEAVFVTEDYTSTDNFIDALKDLKRATGQPTMLKAIEYIKQNRPRIERSTTTTSTTTTTTTTQPTTTEDYYNEEEYDDDYSDENTNEYTTSTTQKLSRTSEQDATTVEPTTNEQTTILEPFISTISRDAVEDYNTAATTTEKHTALESTTECQRLAEDLETTTTDQIRIAKQDKLDTESTTKEQELSYLEQFMTTVAQFVTTTERAIKEEQDITSTDDILLPTATESKEYFTTDEFVTTEKLTSIITETEDAITEVITEQGIYVTQESDTQETSTTEEVIITTTEKSSTISLTDKNSITEAFEQETEDNEIITTTQQPISTTELTDKYLINEDFASTESTAWEEISMTEKQSFTIEEITTARQVELYTETSVKDKDVTPENIITETAILTTTEETIFTTEAEIENDVTVTETIRQQSTEEEISTTGVSIYDVSETETATDEVKATTAIEQVIEQESSTDALNTQQNTEGAIKEIQENITTESRVVSTEDVTTSQTSTVATAILETITTEQIKATSTDLPMSLELSTSTEVVTDKNLNSEDITKVDYSVASTTSIQETIVTEQDITASTEFITSSTSITDQDLTIKDTTSVPEITAIQEAIITEPEMTPDKDKTTTEVIELIPIITTTEVPEYTTYQAVDKNLSTDKDITAWGDRDVTTVKLSTTTTDQQYTTEAAFSTTSELPISTGKIIARDFDTEVPTTDQGFDKQQLSTDETDITQQEVAAEDITISEVEITEPPISTVKTITDLAIEETTLFEQHLNTRGETIEVVSTTNEYDNIQTNEDTTSIEQLISSSEKDLNNEETSYTEQISTTEQDITTFEDSVTTVESRTTMLYSTFTTEISPSITQETTYRPEKEDIITEELETIIPEEAVTTTIKQYRTESILEQDLYSEHFVTQHPTTDVTIQETTFDEITSEQQYDETAVDTDASTENVVTDIPVITEAVITTRTEHLYQIDKITQDVTTAENIERATSIVPTDVQTSLEDTTVELSEIINEVDMTTEEAINEESITTINEEGKDGDMTEPSSIFEQYATTEESFISDQSPSTNEKEIELPTTTIAVTTMEQSTPTELFITNQPAVTEELLISTEYDKVTTRPFNISTTSVEEFLTTDMVTSIEVQSTQQIDAAKQKEPIKDLAFTTATEITTLANKEIDTTISATKLDFNEGLKSNCLEENLDSSEYDSKEYDSVTCEPDDLESDESEQSSKEINVPIETTENTYTELKLQSTIDTVETTPQSVISEQKTTLTEVITEFTSVEQTTPVDIIKLETLQTPVELTTQRIESTMENAHFLEVNTQSSNIVTEEQSTEDTEDQDELTEETITKQIITSKKTYSPTETEDSETTTVIEKEEIANKAKTKEKIYTNDYSKLVEELETDKGKTTGKTSSGEVEEDSTCPPDKSGEDSSELSIEKPEDGEKIQSTTGLIDSRTKATEVFDTSNTESLVTQPTQSKLPDYAVIPESQEISTSVEDLGSSEQPTSTVKPKPTHNSSEDQLSIEEFDSNEQDSSEYDESVTCLPDELDSEETEDSELDEPTTTKIITNNKKQLSTTEELYTVSETSTLQPAINKDVNKIMTEQSIEESTTIKEASYSDQPTAKLNALEITTDQYSTETPTVATQELYTEQTEQFITTENNSHTNKPQNTELVATAQLSDLPTTQVTVEQDITTENIATAKTSEQFQSTYQPVYKGQDNDEQNDFESKETDFKPSDITTEQIESDREITQGLQDVQSTTEDITTVIQTTTTDHGQDATDQYEGSGNQELQPQYFEPNHTTDQPISSQEPEEKQSTASVDTLTDFNNYQQSTELVDSFENSEFETTTLIGITDDSMLTQQTEVNIEDVTQTTEQYVEKEDFDVVSNEEIVTEEPYTTTDTETTTLFEQQATSQQPEPSTSRELFSTIQPTVDEITTTHLSLENQSSIELLTLTTEEEYLEDVTDKITEVPSTTEKLTSIDEQVFDTETARTTNLNISELEEPMSTKQADQTTIIDQTYLPPFTLQTTLEQETTTLSTGIKDLIEEATATQQQIVTEQQITESTLGQVAITDKITSPTSTINVKEVDNTTVEYISTTTIDSTLTSTEYEKSDLDENPVYDENNIDLTTSEAIETNDIEKQITTDSSIASEGSYQEKQFTTETPREDITSNSNLDSDINILLTTDIPNERTASETHITTEILKENITSNSNLDNDINKLLTTDIPNEKTDSERQFTTEEIKTNSNVDYTESELSSMYAAEPKPPGSQSVRFETEVTVEKAGGKLGLNQGRREIMNALETNMRLKILLLPNSPEGKNCYCTCDSKTPPAIIPLAELPTEATEAES